MVSLLGKVIAFHSYTLPDTNDDSNCVMYVFWPVNPK